MSPGVAISGTGIALLLVVPQQLVAGRKRQTAGNRGTQSHGSPHSWRGRWQPGSRRQRHGGSNQVVSTQLRRPPLRVTPPTPLRGMGHRDPALSDVVMRVREAGHEVLQAARVRPSFGNTAFGASSGGGMFKKPSAYYVGAGRRRKECR